MKKKAVWISYDLGIKGDYPGLYAWLDNLNAKECGNSIAFINYNYKSNFLEELKKDMLENIDFKQGDRIYVIRTRKDGATTKISGKFIIGKRKANPWEGYGQKNDDIVDE